MKNQCLLLLLVAVAVDAFTVKPATFTPVTSSKKIRQISFMAIDADDEVKAAAKTGDLYDDEVQEYKDPLSDGMRQKLMREASSGLDSEKPQTNVILYISIAVVVLAGLAGQGIFF
jgi:hypothetical protein